ncbi:hypothetical protein DFR70_109229 [Nocardia tenerifensis]|uniref:Uncharacterized protein n=1 Tax=Nocardia tenerifensis TaxID=228006 RepID=A0A318JZF1_9NOCA|nr:hypothetical protein [Nocardia tenerifensis]PXX61038.1 hypothetical protein DFR70_109229 [Nocardia tenerifensis]
MTPLSAFREWPRSLRTFVAAAAVAPCIVAALHAAPEGDTHGSISAPPVRKPLCAQGALSCSPVLYRPVEGPGAEASAAVKGVFTKKVAHIEA